QGGPWADRPAGSRSRLRPALALPVPLVASCDVEGREPVFAPDDPALVGRPQLARFVEAAEVHLDLVAAAREQRGAASGAEVAVPVFRRRAFDRDRVGREDRRGVEHRAMMLAAVKAMADADAVRRAGEAEAHRATQA